MNIVFLSHASLGAGFVVGSHQLAKSLLKKGHAVSHVSSPVSLLHVFWGKARRQKLFYALINNNKINSDFGFVDYIPICLVPTGYSKILDVFNHWLINKQIQNHINIDSTELKKELRKDISMQKTIY
jgi:hypothetical protein